MHRLSRQLLAYNATRPYSPIVMSSEWSALWRLILLVFLSTTGTIINGFFVSSFFVENSLRRAGFVYLACAGLCDMVVTSAIMPAAVVVLISKIWDISPVCYALQFLSVGATYTYSLFFMMVGLENYIRLCRTRACYDSFMRIPVGFVSVMIYIIGFVAAGVGVYYGMDYDYCTRESFGNYTFRLLTALFFHGIPFAITVILMVSTSFVMRARSRRLTHYKRSQQYDYEYAFTNLNLACYCMYVVAWLPYLVIVNRFPTASDSSYYNCAWLGLCRSIVTSLMYSCLDTNFRHAFAHLFYYCCCKSTVSAPFNHRHRRGQVQETTVHRVGDVKVHIMHHSLASPQRAGCSRETFTCEI